MQQVYREDSSEVECFHWQRDYTEAVFSCNQEDKSVRSTDLWLWMSNETYSNKYDQYSIVVEYLEEFGFMGGIDIIGDDCWSWLVCISACYIHQVRID